MKRAYPNFTEDMPADRAYDLGKWMNAMRDIYIKLHLGNSKNASVDSVVSGWDTNEKRDFLNWLRYYESGDHLKYKKAQNASYYVNDDLNYFLPNPKNIPSPIKNVSNEISSIPQEASEIATQKANERSPEQIKEEKRKSIEDQRKKILGRLNSVEKLLSSQQGHMFAGDDFEKILSSIYELKKQIQTVNKISVSAQTIIDLIVRQANLLKKQGHSDAAIFMIKFAQNTPGDFSINLGDIPSGGSQPQGGGSLSNNPPADISSPPPDKLKDPEEDDTISNFMENLEGAGLTDLNSAHDEIIIDDDVLLDQEVIPDEEDIIVNAQAVPPAPAPAEAPPAPIEVKEPAAPATQEDIKDKTGITPEEMKKKPDVSISITDFDAILDSAFANLTITDVIKKLEDINKIFRNREIGRQLAIVDIMLHRLGLASFFPSLSEAQNKTLENTQYCLTRIEDIISKLRGTIETKEIDLEGKEAPPPQAEKARSALQQEEANEKNRREMKKKLQDEQLMQEIKPEATVEDAQQQIAQQPAQKL